MRDTGTAEKSGTGELRTDLEPLTKRFTALDDPEHARWMSGTFGSDRAPGPSTYWIDAVVTLSERKIDELKTTYASAPAGKSPEVVEGLRAELPAGAFLTSDRLDQAFSHDKWSAKAYLVPERRVLVLVATGT
ncbi:hypothetical protein UK23_22300 [Lentzea aerocolonigenes]|uniref:Uncharacterized protein n=1 Tax=Lentzea aerocolonigenes TaxID=68170 RepID=A0A0F0GTN2_LENAE|nr:hypothetical protein UK23_22300 [Lentzea aerocolonigenes]